jgi:hypothetical protein
MSMILSFLGGAAGQLTSDIEQAEKNSREDAKLGFAALTKRYEENAKANRELTNSMEADKQWITTTYENATPAQIAALVGNPVALEALKKTNDPYKIDLNNYIKIAQGNESPAVQAERIQALPALTKQVATNMEEKMGQSKGSPIGGLIRDFGDTEYEATMGRMAKSQGMSMADLQATSRMQRPTTGAKFNMAATDQPKDVEEIIKTAQVDRFQAEQRFGKDSDQYKAANDKVVAASSAIAKTDKSLDERLNQRLIAFQDETDPAKKEALKKQIGQLQTAIRLNKEAVSTRREREGEPEKATYSKTKNLMEDYLNTRMIEDRGLSWRKFMEPKQIKDPDTGQVIVRLEKKVGLSPEQEQIVAEGMKQIRVQGLKELGLVTESGAPRNPAVKDIVTTYGLNAAAARQPTAPAATPEKPLPMANAPAPSSIPAPKTQAEYNAIRPGTRYIDTDGKEKIKGGK